MTEKINSARFSEEMAKMVPRMLREFTRKQESILSKGNIALPHVVILDCLREMGSLTMGELARILNLTMSAVTVIIDKMVELGLVKRERSKQDRRIVNVMLLKKGRETAEKVDEARKVMTSEIYSVLSGEERVEYLRLIRKVYESLGVRDEK